MSRDEQLKVRLTKEEMERLEAYADRKGYSKSEIIRDYIKRLPKPHGG
jgi:predicted DNA-binding protein